MEAVVLNKTDVLTALRENRAKHEEVHLAAVEGWRKEAEEQLVLTLETLKGGTDSDVLVNLQMPKSHLGDYDRAIQMLEMDINDTVKFEEHEFERYILDNWDWKQQWSRSSRHFAGASYTANYETS